MAPMRMFAISSLLIVSIWLTTTIEGKSTGGTTRESKQLFLVPNPSAGTPSIIFHQPEWNPYTYSIPASGESTVNGRLFGLANLLRPNSCPTCQTCQTCPTCAACAACPAACPALVTPSTLIAIPIAAATSCLGTAANPYGPCTRTTAAPSGSFSVTWGAAVAAGNAPFNTAIISILATCPNTRVTLTCSNVAAGIQITTQTQSITNGGAAVTNPVVVTEGTSMQVTVQAVAAGVANAATAVCFWQSSV